MGIEERPPAQKNIGPDSPELIGLTLDESVAQRSMTRIGRRILGCIAVAGVIGTGAILAPSIVELRGSGGGGQRDSPVVAPTPATYKLEGLTGLSELIQRLPNIISVTTPHRDANGRISETRMDFSPGRWPVESANYKAACDDRPKTSRTSVSVRNVDENPSTKYFLLQRSNSNMSLLKSARNAELKDLPPEKITSPERPELDKYIDPLCQPENSGSHVVSSNSLSSEQFIRAETFEKVPKEDTIGWKQYTGLGIGFAIVGLGIYLNRRKTISGATDEEATLTASSKLSKKSQKPVKRRKRVKVFDDYPKYADMSPSSEMGRQFLKDQAEEERFINEHWDTTSLTDRKPKSGRIRNLRNRFRV